ncbi:exonuclease [Clostridium novyi A str. 4552]|uniref:Nuclease SbcCD subunit C n=1 Tax=Clostridium novyi A str. 4552 TaxID=1444289 RepID=A0A0A0I9V5_CLONO|nr:AAA family ATPase [Clostridium novyi]KGM97677.1 exonuclease [Clostridium novyi A str. 4552]
MKPRVLKIRGLNSFEREQIINFNMLTEKGLFGIFGPTGSGKSTILDAITIALYGKITRTNKGFINTTTKDLIVSYEFEIGGVNDRKVYLAERNIKVNKNDRYNTKYARLIERNGDESKIIAEGPTELQNQIHKIIGLTVDDFTRSVVLPQGKFSEFLKLGGREKRNMLERIFALEKYGQSLVEKIKKVRNTNLKEKSVLEGELKKYENLTEEDFKAKQQELQLELKNQESLKIEKKQVDEQYEIYKEVWMLQKELDSFISKKIKLKEKLKDINLKRESLKRGQNAIKIKPFIDEVEATNKNIKENREKLKLAIESLNAINEKVKVTEEDYITSQKEKDEKIPELIKKESDFSLAIDTVDKTEKLEIEVQSLRNDYIAIKSKRDKILKQLKDIDDSKGKAVIEIKNIEKRLNDIKIDPEYREKLQYALQKENDYKKSLTNKKELHNKLQQKEEILKEVSQKYNDILSSKNTQDNLVKELEEKNRILKENNPGDNSLLLEKSQELNVITKKLEEVINEINRKDELEKIIEDINNTKNPINTKLEEIKNTLGNDKVELEQLDNKIENIKKNNLASLLAGELVEGSPCPVCGSIHHTNIAIKIDNDEILKHQEKRKKLQQKIENLTTKMTELSIEFASITKEEEHNLNELKLILEKLNDINIKNLNKQKENKEIEFKQLKEKIDKYNNDKNVIESNLKVEGEKKSKVDLDESKLSENVKNETVLIKELKEELKEENKIFNKLYNEYESLKEYFGAEKISSKAKEILIYEKESEKLKNKEKELRSIVENYDSNKQTLANEEKKLIGILSQIQQSGTEKRKITKENREYIKRICGDKDPKEYLPIIKEKIKEISDRNNKLKNQLEKQKELRERISNEKLSLEKAEAIFNETLKEQQLKLEKSLKDSEFKDISETKKYILDEAILSNIENEINIFDDEVKDVKSNINRIEKKLQGNRIEKDKWQELTNYKLQMEDHISNNIKNIATLQKIIDDFKEDLENLKELRKREKELEHKLSLISDLMKLVEGNKFVEFVAMNQLKYIAREASKRLKDITRDRYALEIDSEGNFAIRDDFNGGQIRDASTLSGGETFLTSLSLALALSSQVQLKGSAPLEFFFLDEGFGTLDTDLLDIVMNSLEKLHSSRLSVGIISHVEELKNRVPVKLIVYPAKPGEGGSKVTLEYS